MAISYLGYSPKMAILKRFLGKSAAKLSAPYREPFSSPETGPADAPAEKPQAAEVQKYPSLAFPWPFSPRFAILTYTAHDPSIEE
jgi:hypothetical protein